MQLENVVFANHGGNVAAIVFDEVPVATHTQINNLIQANAPFVEQVLFVQKRGKAIHAQMAGGEFCGNAACALGYVLASGKESRQQFTMSGLSTPVMVEVKPDRATLVMQTKIKNEVVPCKGATIPVVHLEGISHAVLFSENGLYEDLKKSVEGSEGKGIVKKLLDELGLTRLSACGLLFVENRNGKLCLFPHIFVRDVNTLRAEAACASGSIAVASLLNKNVLINQPSGKPLYVVLQQVGDFIRAEVAGEMAILRSGSLCFH